MKRAIARKSLELGIGCCKIAYPNLGRTLEGNVIIADTLENHSILVRCFLIFLSLISNIIKFLFYLTPAFLFVFFILEYFKLHAMSQENLGTRSAQHVADIDEFYSLIIALVGVLFFFMYFFIVGIIIIGALFIALRL